LYPIFPCKELKVFCATLFNIIAQCDEKKGWMSPRQMKQAPLTTKSCKKTKLPTVACDVKLEIIFYGICVHDLCFLLVMNKMVIHYQWRMLCGEVPSLVAFSTIWLFFH
jgi:hypothetical protein